MRGGDPAQILGDLRTAVRGEAVGESSPLGAGLEALLLTVRHDNTDQLRAGVIAAVRSRQPSAPITLHANPDPWATGPSPGLTPTAAADVDALLVAAWPTTQESADAVTAAAEHQKPVDANAAAGEPGRRRRPRQAAAGGRR